jgi:hypothetical protein
MLMTLAEGPRAKKILNQQEAITAVFYCQGDM